MPEGLEIDRKSKLDSTAPAYDMHLIVHTGVSDWPSRIEDDGRFPEIKIIKEMLGKNGKYFNVSGRSILLKTAQRDRCGCVSMSHYAPAACLQFAQQSAKT